MKAFVLLNYIKLPTFVYPFYDLSSNEVEEGVDEGKRNVSRD